MYGPDEGQIRLMIGCFIFASTLLGALLLGVSYWYWPDWIAVLSLVIGSFVSFLGLAVLLFIVAVKLLPNKYF